MDRAFFFLLCSLVLWSCGKTNDDETHFREVNDFYIYDVQEQTLTQITNDETQGNYDARFIENGNGMISVGSTTQGQFLYRHQGLTSLKVAVAVDQIYEGTQGPGIFQKLTTDTSGKKI